MSGNVINLPMRGKTFLTGPNRTAPTSPAGDKDLEGIKKAFRDIDFSTRGMKTLRTGGEVICQLVRNDSGIALLPKRVAVWKAGYRGRRVSGYVTTDYAMAAGVVDEWLPSAGVADDDLFWLTVKGPSRVLNDIAAATTAHIDEGAYIVALTAATSQATTAGRVQAFVATSNATNAVSEALNRIGVAMSTRTSANTNSDVLADILLA
jgi:hypothetical protein